MQHSLVLSDTMFTELITYLCNRRNKFLLHIYEAMTTVIEGILPLWIQSWPRETKYHPLLIEWRPEVNVSKKQTTNR